MYTYICICMHIYIRLSLSLFLSLSLSLHLYASHSSQFERRFKGSQDSSRVLGRVHQNHIRCQTRPHLRHTSWAEIDKNFPTSLFSKSLSVLFSMFYRFPPKLKTRLKRYLAGMSWIYPFGVPKMGYVMYDQGIE